MNKSDITKGQTVVINSDSNGYHSLNIGILCEVGTVDSADASLTPLPGQGQTFTQWVPFADFDLVDAKRLEQDFPAYALTKVKAEAEAFKAEVVTKAKAAAKSHGWCEVVDDVLNDLGLADLLPRESYVDVTFRIKATAPAGSDDYTLKDEAITAVFKDIRDGHGAAWVTKTDIVK